MADVEGAKAIQRFARRFRLTHHDQQRPIPRRRDLARDGLRLLAGDRHHPAAVSRQVRKAHPVEQLESVVATPNGFEGDRRYAIYDVETGFGLTARRVPELLFATARLLDGGELEITLNGEEYCLKPGDSFYFESATPHRWKNPGRKETLVLWVNTPPTF